HGDFAGLVDGVTELEVHGRVAAAVFGGDDNGPAELAPQLAALGVDGALLVLDRRPVGMPGHGCSLLCLMRSAPRTLDAGFSIAESSDAASTAPAFYTFFGRQGKTPLAPWRSRR